MEKKDTCDEISNTDPLNQCQISSCPKGCNK